MKKIAYLLLCTMAIPAHAADNQSQNQNQQVKSLALRINEQKNQKRLTEPLLNKRNVPSAGIYSHWAQAMGNSTDTRMGQLLGISLFNSLSALSHIKLKLLNDIINEPIKDLLLEASGQGASGRYLYASRSMHQTNNPNKNVPVIALDENDKGILQASGTNVEDMTYKTIQNRKINENHISDLCSTFFKTDINALQQVGQAVVCAMYDEPYEQLDEQTKTKADILATKFATNVEIEIRRHLIHKEKASETYNEAIRLFKSHQLQTYLPASPVFLIGKAITLPNGATNEDKKQYYWLKLKTAMNESLGLNATQQKELAILTKTQAPPFFKDTFEKLAKNDKRKAFIDRLIRSGVAPDYIFALANDTSFKQTLLNITIDNKGSFWKRDDAHNAWEKAKQKNNIKKTK